MSRSDDALREHAKASLEAAKAARQRDDADTRLASLEEARSAAVTLGDAPLLSSACWRLAKARFDERRDDLLIEALEPLVAMEVEERGVWGIKHRTGPFDHYPAGLRALPSLARRHWDRAGYGDDTLTELWTAWIAHHEAEEDPFMVAWGHVQLGWQQACRGELEALRGVVTHYARQTPRTFGDGPHRHPRAPDAPSSVWWVQLDLARTLLRGATWADDDRLAWEASELLEDAAEDTGLDRTRDFWFLDARLRAATRFGWDVPEHHARAYRGDHPVGAFHGHRAAAWIAATEARRDDALRALQAAWDLRDDDPGPEWLVEIATEAARLSEQDTWHDRAQEAAARWGVVVPRVSPPDGPRRP